MPSKSCSLVLETKPKPFSPIFEQGQLLEDRVVASTGGLTVVERSAFVDNVTAFVDNVPAVVDNDAPVVAGWVESSVKFFEQEEPQSPILLEESLFIGLKLDAKLYQIKDVKNLKISIGYSCTHVGKSCFLDFFSYFLEYLFAENISRITYSRRHLAKMCTGEVI